MTWLRHRLLALTALGAAALLTALLLLGSDAQAGGTTVWVGSATAAFGGQANVNVEVHSLPANGLGAWTLNVTYNPGVVSVVSCDGGVGICNGAFGPGTVRVAGSSAGGLHGSPVVATITFACGQTAGSSAVTPEILVLRDATIGNLQPINATTQAGGITCSAATPPPPAPTATRPPAATATHQPVATQPGAPTPTFTPRPGGHLASPTPPRQGPTTAPATGNAATASAPTPTLTGSVLGSTHGPTPSQPKPPVVRSVGPPAAASVRPETSSVLLAPNKLDTNAKVIGTNLVLAMILLIVLFCSAALFNGAMDENREEIENVVGRLTAPFRRAADAMRGGWKAIGGIPQLEWALGMTIMLALTGFIYSFNDPTWGLNGKSLVLFLSVVIACGLLTIIYEGGEALVHRRRHHVHAGIRLFPMAIAIAVGFVVLSRLVHFQAPVMFGFIAASAVLVPVALDHRQAGVAIFIPAVALLLLSLVSWALVIPLRDASNNSSSWGAVLPGEVAAILFASSIEGLLFSMIPLEFLDGHKIIRWNPFAWVMLIGIPAFLFCWVILNPAAKSFDVFLERRVVTALCVIGGFAALSVIMWSFFYIQHRRQETATA